MNSFRISLTHKPWLRGLIFVFAVLLPTLLPGGVAPAQTLPLKLAVLAGMSPLPDTVLHGTAGEGLLMVKAEAPAPGAGRVVLWDEVARTSRTAVKSVPGFSVTVNGVTQ
ncbi:hypothetical protein [Acidocella sp.]|uniref:hypothetical protein n=1 Tax=Acidocella sp. TaxID=50710 RepID=UPI00262B0742|nr:hypothetical protein [Acidocella sp.]